MGKDIQQHVSKMISPAAQTSVSSQDDSIVPVTQNSASSQDKSIVPKKRPLSSRWLSISKRIRNRGGKVLNWAGKVIDRVIGWVITIACLWCFLHSYNSWLGAFYCSWLGIFYIITVKKDLRILIKRAWSILKTMLSDPPQDELPKPPGMAI